MLASPTKSLRTPALLLALTMALASCSKDEETATGLDLLARLPDRVIDQPGRFLAGETELWSRGSPGGWWFKKRPDGEPVAWSRAASARFRAPSILPQEHVIRLRLVAPTDDPVQIQVRLNGEAVLEAAEIGKEPSTITVPTRAEAWRRGENTLEIVAPRRIEVPGLGFVGFGVLAVDYAEPLPIELRDDSVRMPAGTGLVYRLIPIEGTALSVRGRSDGGGELGVRIRRLDLATNEYLPDEESTSLAAAEDGSVGGSIPLPSSGGLNEVELAWLGATADSSFELRELSLHSVQPVQRVPVIFVSVDTLSAQHMSVYGYPRKTTPNLERIAADFVLFENCRANAPWTVPSYMSQFSGLLPRAHSLDRREDQEGPLSAWEQDILAPQRWTLAEDLRAAGYRTAAFVDNPWLAAGMGIEQGFDLLDDSAAKLDPHDPHGGIDHIRPLAVDWLRRQGGAPSFLLFQVFDTHAPYNPCKPFDGSFDEDGLPLPDISIPPGPDQQYAYDCLLHYVSVAKFGRKQEEWPAQVPVAPIITDYDEKVAQVDAGIGRFVEDLKALGLYDEALIVISADHGEGTGDHGYWFGHAQLYNSVLHVPLMIKLPRSRHAGKRIPDLVQLVDLYPTITELAIGHSVPGLHGRSLVPLIEGQELPPMPVVSEGGPVEQFAVEDRGWKLIVSHPFRGSPQLLVTHPRLDREAMIAVEPRIAGFHEPWEIQSLLRKNPRLEELIRSTLGEQVLELYHVAEDAGERNDRLREDPEKRLHALLGYLEAGMKAGELAREGVVVDLPPSTFAEDGMAEKLEALGYFGDE